MRDGAKDACRVHVTPAARVERRSLAVRWTRARPETKCLASLQAPAGSLDGYGPDGGTRGPTTPPQPGLPPSLAPKEVFRALAFGATCGAPMAVSACVFGEISKMIEWLILNGISTDASCPPHIRRIICVEAWTTSIPSKLNAGTCFFWRAHSASKHNCGRNAYDNLSA
jgi:hypothetical protein